MQQQTHFSRTSSSFRWKEAENGSNLNSQHTHTPSPSRRGRTFFAAERILSTQLHWSKRAHPHLRKSNRVAKLNKRANYFGNFWAKNHLRDSIWNSYSVSNLPSPPAFQGHNVVEDGRCGGGTTAPLDDDGTNFPIHPHTHTHGWWRNPPDERAKLSCVRAFVSQRRYGRALLLAWFITMTTGFVGVVVWNCREILDQCSLKKYKFVLFAYKN